MKVDVIIPCGGSGSRMGLGYNKLLLPMRGRTLIENTVSAFFLPYVNKIVLPCASAEKGLFRSLFFKFPDSFPDRQPGSFIRRCSSSFQSLYLFRNGVDGGFLFLEMSLRIEGVEYWRDESADSVATSCIPGKSCKIEDPVLRVQTVQQTIIILACTCHNDQYSQHLSFRKRRFQTFIRVYMLYHLFRSQPYCLVRTVPEGPGESVR